MRRSLDTLRRVEEENSSDDGQATDKDESDASWGEFDENTQGEEGQDTEEFQATVAAGASARRGGTSASGNESRLKRRSLSSSPSKLRVCFVCKNAFLIFNEITTIRASCR